MPKPPPTFSAITRNCVSASLNTSVAMHAADHVRPLHGAAQRGAPVAQRVFGDAAARLHGVGGEAADHHAVLDDVRRGGEHPGDRRGIAGGVGEGLVVRAAFPHRDGAGPDRILGGGDGGQRCRIRPRSPRRRPWPAPTFRRRRRRRDRRDSAPVRGRGTAAARQRPGCRRAACAASSGAGCRACAAPRPRRSAPGGRRASPWRHRSRWRRCGHGHGANAAHGRASARSTCTSST